MTVYFAGYILVKGLRGITFSFLTTPPNPIIGIIGILPAIINTAYIILLTLAFAVPVGVGGAVYINEYAKSRKLISVIEFTTETLSGIPSIIFGVFGYVFFCVFLNLKVSLLSGALTLTIMVLPTIIRTAQEALKAVPASYREGAAGLGASKWYMIRTILLPNASGGIVTAVVLSVGRIVGESAALLLVAGGSAMYMPKGSFFEQIKSSGSTLAVELYRYAYSRGENDIGFAIAALLLIIVIGLNLSVKLIGKRLKGDVK
ncbi:phosphate transport system permease protein PstA [Synergistales bacterium]|nr:phosphate transport system permease protein PstA [Synergistales bacterium]